MIKPDGVQKRLIGEIISRFEKRGLTLRGMKLLQIPTDLAKKHYEQHKEKSFFKELVNFITSGPVVAMVWEGENAVSIVRQMMGPTDPAVAPPGTIRGDFCLNISQNVVHGSDSLEAAEREISLFFNEDELV